MSSSSEKKREEQEKWPMMQTRQFESMFDSFRREMERMMARTLVLSNGVGGPVLV